MDSQRLEHDDFLRRLLRNERKILRYVMAIYRVADQRGRQRPTAFRRSSPIL